MRLFWKEGEFGVGSSVTAVVALRTVFLSGLQTEIFWGDELLDPF